MFKLVSNFKQVFLSNHSRKSYENHLILNLHNVGLNDTKPKRKKHQPEEHIPQ